MPELPEVETVRSGLEPLLIDRQLESVICHRASLRYPLPDLSSLAGRRIQAIRRRAKYLLFDLDGGNLATAQTLVWHLGMTGQFHVLPQQAKPGLHEHVHFNFSDGQSLRYRDARRFGYAGLMNTNALLQHPWFARLGPEPMEEHFNAGYLQQVCRTRKAPIKSLIMDASVVVGVGNIYASESLFRSGIHPARAARRISDKRLAVLTAMIKQVLTEAIDAGGSSISDFVHADGKPGYFSHAFRVYGRGGEPCVHCGKPIRRLVQSGRSTFYCRACQH